MLCALPGLGNVIGKTGTAGSKAASISGSIAKSLHIIGNGGFVATGFYSIGEMGYNNWQRYVVGNETYTLEQAGADLLTGALSILSIYGGGKGLGWDQVEVPTKLKGCINDVPLTSTSSVNNTPNKIPDLPDDKLKEYNRQAKKYGTGSIIQLPDGRFRFYEKMKPARTQGEMAGARHVREWNPITDAKRDWYETLDHSGNIRQVRPSPQLTGGVKVHYMFDENGNYIESWSP